MKTILRFFKNSGIFFVGTILSKTIIFLLLPLYTNCLSTESYGYYDLSVTYVTVLTSILYFDIWATLLRFLYDYVDGKEKEKVKRICWGIFCISTLAFIAVGGAVCFAYRIRYGVLILAYGVSVNVQTMCSFAARGAQKNVQFAVSGILNTFVTVMGNVGMLLGLKMDVEALYLSAILGNLVQSIFLCVSVPILPAVSKSIVDKLLAKRIIRYTLPLGINSMAYWMLTGYNRVILEKVMGLSANGVYAIGNKFGAALTLVTTCFTYAWQDIAFKQQDNSSLGQFYGKAVSLYYCFLGVGVACMLPCFSVLFPFLVGESFSGAYSTIHVFLIMAMLSAVSTFIGNIFYALKDTHTLFATMVISCICNVILCRPFVELWGINGANISTCISFAVNILIRCLLLNRQIRLRVNGIWILGTTAVLTCVAYCYNLNNLAINVITILVLTILLVAGSLSFLKLKRKVSGAS